MKRIVLIGLAAVCALAAVLVALVGLRSGKDEPNKPEPARYSVVVANADFPPGHYLRPEDLRVAKLATLPTDAFATTAGLAGKQLAQPAVAGQPLTRSQLAASHPLAGQLRPGERAVALQTTKIVGVGGYLKPGDWVDVLVYFRAQEETASASSAMLALSRLRVLSYENELPPEPEATPAGDAAPAKEDKADADKPARLAEERKPRSDKNPSVVLAVPADQAVRLLLAAEAGEVRLALRPPEPAVDGALAGAPVYTPAPANAREAQALKLTQLSFSKPVAAASAARAPAAAPAATAKVKIVNRIEIFDGDKPRAAEPNK